MVGAVPGEDLPGGDVSSKCYGASKHLQPPLKQQQPDVEAESGWFEEEIDDDLKLCYALNSVLHRGASKYQEIVLIDNKHFGKALIIDGKMQSTESDEFICHESLIHPPLLFHPNPKTVFIMGGGEGSAAREVLRHNTVQRVVMCDIDQEVVDFCRTYLTVNRQAFSSEKLCLIINDARAELEKNQEKFNVIVGDLADPVEGGPCYELYTKSFYELIVKPKLKDLGIFVTQSSHRFTTPLETSSNMFKLTQLMFHPSQTPGAGSWPRTIHSISLLSRSTKESVIGSREESSPT